MAKHHPDKTLYPNWTIETGNQLFHKCLTVAQRMKANCENLAILRAVCDALEYIYLMKRKVLDEDDTANGN